MPLALITGHSILKRLSQYLVSGTDDRLSLYFNLNRVVFVMLQGVGGRTVEKWMKFDMSSLCFCPDIILLLGENDIKSFSDPETLAFKLISLASQLHRTYHVKQIVLCQLLPRFTLTGYTPVNYCDVARSVNEILRTEVTSYPYIAFWDHNGKFPFPVDRKDCSDKFRADACTCRTKANGIYSNHLGVQFSQLAKD
ncbi:hypothetical protein ACJMK2_027212 [Sinanodonta woodiana]|uniref:SGNH hydrolase-type esterase domain-containing protein n=1 Tax=Sinanodonta woodiana TaxID=1069815 RepID=A0ABD3XM28_SINWO